MTEKPHIKNDKYSEGKTGTVWIVDRKGKEHIVPISEICESLNKATDRNVEL